MFWNKLILLIIIFINNGSLYGFESETFEMIIWMLPDFSLPWSILLIYK